MDGVDCLVVSNLLLMLWIYGFVVMVSYLFLVVSYLYIADVLYSIHNII